MSGTVPNSVSDAKIVQESYDKMARDYDNINGEAFYANQYEVYEKHLAKYLDSKYQCSLDLGCGTGLQTTTLARRSEYCVGVDLSPRLLSLAKAKCNTLHNIDFVRCDVEYMPFRDEVFDCIISYGEVISHLQYYTKAFQEASRISTNLAVFILSVLNKWNLSLIYSPDELRNAINTKVGQERSWSIDIPPKMERVSLRLKTFSKSELEGILRDNGFEVWSYTGIHILSLIIPLGLQYDNVGFWWHCFRLLGKGDLLINEKPPFRGLGYTVVVSAKKVAKPV